MVRYSGGALDTSVAKSHDLHALYCRCAVVGRGSLCEKKRGGYGGGEMTGSDFKNSKWCKEGGTKEGQAKVAKGFKSWTNRVGNYGLLSKARELYQFFLSPTVTGTQKAVVVGALLYLISPLDLIPDFIPVVGWLDDLGVAAFALNYIFSTLRKAESGDGTEIVVPKEFKLSEQQVVDAEIIAENKTVGFGLGHSLQTQSPSADLTRRFDEIAEIARTLKVDGGEAVCAAFEKMIFDTRLFHVSVVGRFSSGKSTLLNALLGKNILPAKPVPTTKAITYLVKGSSCSIASEQADGTVRLETDVDEGALLGLYDDMTQGAASAITIALPDFPFPDLTLIDTPGVEDPNESVLQKVTETVRYCDVVVLMIDANYPESEVEYEFIRKMAAANGGRKLFAVINKCDGKTPEQRIDIQARCLDELKRRGVYDVEVHALSAVECDEGFARFREKLFEYLRSGIKSKVAAYAKSEMDGYARTLQAVCTSIVEATPGKIEEKVSQAGLLAEKRRIVSAGFDRQEAELSRKIDGCRDEMRAALANFIGELKSEVRMAINASDFDTLKNTDAIAMQVNKKLRAFVDGQLASMATFVAKELEESDKTLRDEFDAVEIPLPKQVEDPSGMANMFFPAALAASYLLFGLSTAFIGTLVFAVLGRNYFEGAIRRFLESVGLQKARAKMADEVSGKLGECEKKIWLQLSSCIECVREKSLGALEARRSACMAKFTPLSPPDDLSLEAVRNCRSRLAAVLGD